MALYKDGDIFVSLFDKPDDTGSIIQQYDRATYARIGSYGSPADTVGAFLSPLGHLWVLHFSARGIECWDANGAVLWTRPTTNKPECVLFALGYAYVGCVDVGELLQFQLDGTFVASHTLATDRRGIDWLVQHPDGSFLYTSEGQRVLRWNPQTRTQMADFGLIADPEANFVYTIKRLSNGTYLVVEDSTGVHRLSPDGAYLGKYASLPDGGAYFSIDVEADGQHFWATNVVGGKQVIQKVNVASGALVATINTGVSGLVTGVVNVTKTVARLLRIF
jgi:hypothetical protein